MQTKTSPLIHRLTVLALGCGMLGIPFLAACADTGQPAIELDDFTTGINNPFFPLFPGTIYLYEGTSGGSQLRDEFYVTHDTKAVMGVTCRVVRDRAFVDGALEEETLDSFAQDEDGNVWYFGEDAKQLDANGNVVSTEGSWEAGVNGALPGIAMKAHPQVGDTYRQEFAVGVAEDMAKILALHQTVTVSHQTYTNCVKIKDFSPLDPGVVEQKYYARGVGFILSVMVKGGQERLALVSIVRTDPEDYTTKIDNRFFPLVPGTTYIYRGTSEDSQLRDEFYVTPDTKVVMGVTCRVVRDRAFVDGVLEEETLDWFAQDEEGNVWYFGEDAKQLDANGNVVSTEGSWEAGVNGALPGMVMEAHPQVEDTYRQEFALGVAEDMATVLAVHQTVTVSHQTYTNCVKIKNFSPLDPGVVEQKYYARGVGFILSVMVKGGQERLALKEIVRN